MCIDIHAHLHTPTKHTGLLGENHIAFALAFTITLIHYLIFILVFVTLSVNTYIRHKQKKLKEILS
jgi:hypothetical protein